LDNLTVFLIAIGLAMDTLAVNLGVGTQAGISRRSIFRLALHFGIFQGLMTLIGWVAGSLVSHFITSIDHWIILGLLLWVGIRMILSGFGKTTEPTLPDPSRGKYLVMLSVATSLDALAIGISFSFLEGNILIASLIIALVSFLLSLAGGFLGRRLGIAFGKKMEIIGGVILIGIGIRILISHLT
jgi:putative Mn2+ efflux pump MntP